MLHPAPVTPAHARPLVVPYPAPVYAMSHSAQAPHYPNPGPVMIPMAPYPGYAQLPGMEILIASSYGIPKPSLPTFDRLKMALDNLMNNHVHLSEQYKY